MCYQTHAAHAAHVPELLTVPCTISSKSAPESSAAQLSLDAAAQFGEDVAAQLLRLTSKNPQTQNKKITNMSYVFIFIHIYIYIFFYLYIYIYFYLFLYFVYFI